MDNYENTVCAELALVLIGPEEMAVPLVASLYYGRSDPYAVRMAFHTGTGEPVEWVFARDLLAAGLKGRAGAGDIRIWPSPRATPAQETGQLFGEGAAARGDIINVELFSPSGHAHFQAPAVLTAEFLQRTYRLVPAGQEASTVDIEAELEALLR
jgi:hypothetical protein